MADLPQPDEDRKPEYLFRRPNGQYIYVSASMNNYSYGSFRLFMGEAPLLDSLSVTKVERHRDGGTTLVETSAGILYVPTRLRPHQRAKWNDELLTSVDIPNALVIERDGSACLPPDEYREASAN